MVGEFDVEVLRDAHGVPHVFAADLRGAYFGLGYASAQDAPRSLPLHQTMLRGELTAQFGDVPLPDRRLPFLDALAGTTFFRHDGGRSLKMHSLLDVDRFVKLFGYHENAVAEFPDLKPRTRTILAAFADGVNCYYADRGSSRPVEYEAATEVAWWSFFEHSLTIGLFGLSNAFGVDPRRGGGSVWIGGDPHYWIHHRSEAHIVCPEFELCGVWDGHINIGALGGSGTTRHLAQQGTAAGLEGPTVYRERVNPRNREEYWDWRTEGWTAFESADHEIGMPDGSSRSFVARSTHHGPVVAELLEAGNPYCYVIKTPFDSNMGRSLEEYLEFWLAESVDEAISYLHDTNFSRGHRIIGDKRGNIGFATLGPSRIRDESVNWLDIVDGSLKESEWQAGAWRPADPLFPLPAYANPPRGFIQSANDASWFSTVPRPDMREDYPAYLFKPGWFELGTRGARQRELLAGDNVLDLSDLESVLFDSYVPRARLALGALHDALNRNSAISVELTGDARLLDGLVASWDGFATADSPAMTAAFWVDRHFPGGLPTPLIAVSSDPTSGGEMGPPVIGDADVVAYATALEAAARDMRKRYGTLAKPWGEVHVFVTPANTFAMPGGCNALRALFGSWEGAWDAPDAVDDAGVTHVNFGSHALRLASFSPDGEVSVYSCMLGGQIAAHEHPDSPHTSDQAALMSAGRLKRLPLTYSDVVAASRDEDHAGCNHPASVKLSSRRED